jgi:hypothetical protein
MIWAYLAALCGGAAFMLGWHFGAEREWRAWSRWLEQQYEPPAVCGEVWHGHTFICVGRSESEARVGLMRLRERIETEQCKET